MSLCWRDVACGLPVPPLPTPLGCRTQFFSTALIVTDGELAHLQDVAQRLLGERIVVRLPDGEGPDGVGPEWPCRLVALPDVEAAADGQWRARLEFEVVELLPGGA